MFDLEDKIILITGAAGNLGQAVARAFLAAQSKLVLVDRRSDRLPMLFPELTSSADHMLATDVDVLDSAAVEGLIAAAVERFGRIDVLANTVGGYLGGTRVRDTSLDLWDGSLDLNAKTAFILSKALIPVMLEQKSGRIIHVAARSGLEGSSRQLVHSVAKSAVIRLTETLSAELKRSGINVNCILPSTIDTPQNRESMPKAHFDRWVEPEAIADVFTFLASHAARAVTGAAIPVYGKG
jgi:NAD(P)-dependent dehydrogenase (short-subunit alcohol dehydrogenase family)